MGLLDIYNALTVGSRRRASLNDQLDYLNQLQAAQLGRQKELSGFQTDEALRKMREEEDYKMGQMQKERDRLVGDTAFAQQMTPELAVTNPITGETLPANDPAAVGRARAAAIMAGYGNVGSQGLGQALGQGGQGLNAALTSSALRPGLSTQVQDAQEAARAQSNLEKVTSDYGARVIAGQYPYAGELGSSSAQAGVGHNILNAALAGLGLRKTNLEQENLNTPTGSNLFIQGLNDALQATGVENKLKSAQAGLLNAEANTKPFIPIPSGGGVFNYKDMYGIGIEPPASLIQDRPLFRTESVIKGAKKKQTRVPGAPQSLLPTIVHPTEY